MCRLCEVRVSELWINLRVGQHYRTPDFQNAAIFEISVVDENHIQIRPQNITINRISFEDALHYLLSNNHMLLHPCEIDSDNNIENAGPLCRAARERNESGRRCINYILPIFQNNGMVGINCMQRNTAWLVTRWC